MKKQNSSILDITSDITLDELDIIINELKIGFLLVSQANRHYRNEILLEKSKWWIEKFFGKNSAAGKEYKTFIEKGTVVDLRSLASDESDLNELKKNLMKLIRDKRKLDKNFINQCMLKIQQALKLVKKYKKRALFDLSARDGK